MEHWAIYYYNELDAEFGYDAGTQVYKNGLEKAVAKSICRHLNKTTPDFIEYYAQEDPRNS